MKSLYIIDDNSQNKYYAKIFESYRSNLHISVGPELLSSKELQEDKNEKIIGIANPELINWELKASQLKNISNIRGICTQSSWKEYIDLEYCVENSIEVMNNVGINSQSVAEHAVFQLMALAKNLPLQIINNFNTETCIKAENTELERKTVGIIGLGNIGSRIAKMSEGLGMKVIYWSRNKKNVSFKYQTLNKVLSKSDAIFNCIETNLETKGFLNKSNLSLMKKSAYFISVLGGAGWGPEDDLYLINAVKKGKLAGFSIENNHHETFKLPEIGGYNIFMSSATAFYTKEANERAREKFNENIISLL